MYLCCICQVGTTATGALRLVVTAARALLRRPTGGPGSRPPKITDHGSSTQGMRLCAYVIRAICKTVCTDRGTSITFYSLWHGFRTCSDVPFLDLGWNRIVNIKQHTYAVCTLWLWVYRAVHPVSMGSYLITTMGRAESSANLKNTPHLLPTHTGPCATGANSCIRIMRSNNTFL